MRLKAISACALLVLGVSITAAQTSGPDLQVRDLMFETRDLVFQTEEAAGAAHTGKPAPSPPKTGATLPPIAKAPLPPAPHEVSPKVPTVPWGRRVALVVGNGGYKVGPLANPGKDATAVAEVLRRQLKFDRVILGLDLGREGFLKALRDFSREASNAGLALVYFAGHGTEVGGQNYLIPVDAALAKATDLSLEAIPLTTVLEQIDGATKLKLVILDSCRNDIFPLAGSTRGKSRGLARIEPTRRNALVVYAAKHGSVAADGAPGAHSPLTAALLKHITARYEVQRLFRLVRDDVLDARRCWGHLRSRTSTVR
jgi:hypothetical protein